MKGLGLLCTISTVLMVEILGLGATDPCENLEQLPICNETQYELYRECVEDVRSLREKRQILCLNKSVTVNPISKEEQSDVIEPSLNVIPALQSIVTVNPIITYASTVKHPMLKSLNRKVIFQTDDEDYEYKVPTNVTTVFRLTNVVNNTNIVNVPTHINSTNVNNIHIYSNSTDDGGEEHEVEKQKCCTAVQPKSCHASTQGFKCKHKKFKTCGSQCTSEIIHVQRRKRCDSYGNCKQKIAYVPQPEKPTCVYIEQWPFVACGKPANMKIICDGCYDHYGHGFDSYHDQLPTQCRGCYDDAFDHGPLYRRGPVLRPFHYHEPPCYITGNCPMTYDDCGYGCYGHEMIDPAWGAASPYDPNLDETNTLFVEHMLDIANDTESDWGTPVHKCTVITDDNTISVHNCTDIVDNKYAASPLSYPYYKPAQFQPKPVYKVKQTMLRQNMVDEIDDPSSGDDMLILDPSVSFTDDSYENYDYSQ